MVVSMGVPDARDSLIEIPNASLCVGRTDNSLEASSSRFVCKFQQKIEMGRCVVIGLVTGISFWFLTMLFMA